MSARDTGQRSGHREGISDKGTSNGCSLKAIEPGVDSWESACQTKDIRSEVSEAGLQGGEWRGGGQWGRPPWREEPPML